MRTQSSEASSQGADRTLGKGTRPRQDPLEYRVAWPTLTLSQDESV